MVKKIGLVLGITILLLLAYSLVRYYQFSSQQFADLSSGGDVVETALGPVEYRLSGDDGPIVLFFHGTPGGYDQGPTDQTGFRFLTPSRPGYLQTPLDVGVTPEAQAQAFGLLLDALDIEKVIVMGVSGGGPAAISFAANYPERTRGLVALEAVSMSQELESVPWFFHYDYSLWVMLSLLELQSDQELVSVLVPDPENQQLILDDPEKLSEFRSLVWSLWPQSLRGTGMRNDQHQFTQLDLPLQKITAPTLVIHGTADINVPFSHGELIAEAISGAQMVRIEGADHMLPLTHRAEMEQALEEFAKRL